MGTDIETPEATPEAIDAYLGEPLRGCLVELVHECLKQKPENVSEETYFAETLEPLCRRLVGDCLKSRNEDAVAFVQKWVKEQEQQEQDQKDAACDLGVPSPLSCMLAWCDKRELEEADERERWKLQAELEVLRRKHRALEEGLGRTVLGKRILEAVEEGDQLELDAALAAAGLDGGTAHETRGTPATSSTAPANHRETALVLAGSTEAANDALAQSPSTAEAEAAESMGAVLRALRDRGVKSASAAFAHFGPGDDGRIDAQHLLTEISHLGVLSPSKATRLVQALDRLGTGRICYRDFRAKIVGFLATSHDFHSSLSDDEFAAIMTRINVRLQMQNLLVSEAFKEWDSNGSGILECSEFMAGLRSLRLGLSGKEVAQVFNALSVVGSPPATTNTGAGNEHEPGRESPTGANNAHSGFVSLAALESAVVSGAKQNRLRDSALASFARLRESLELGAVDASLRRYAEQPECHYMFYSGFTAMANDADPSISSAEIGRLWCVLEKQDDIEEPAVDVAELVRWMFPVDLTLFSQTSPAGFLQTGGITRQSTLRDLLPKPHTPNLKLEAKAPTGILSSKRWTSTSLVVNH